jgi:hypothetical protein
MEIKPTEIYPFALEASALRQNKATDGESEGSWRLDLIIKNVGKSKRAKIGYSIRYFDQQGKFLGLDTPYWHQGAVFRPQENRDISLHVNPPEHAITAEFRIFSKASISSSDDPWWAAPLIIISSVLAILLFRILTK